MFNLMYTNDTAGSENSISLWCGGCHDFYYRSAIRFNNKSGNVSGVTSGPTTRLVTTALVGDNHVHVASTASLSTSPASTIHIGAEEFNVGAIAGDQVTFVSGTIATQALVGSLVTIEGAGMEVYYDLDGDDTADQNYMHAVDVDLQYIPRNGSIASPGLNLANNITAGTDLPVYDQPTADGNYDSSDMLNCLTCHFAHGSNATMAEDAILGESGREFENPAQQMPWGADSMLLRLNNRAVCNNCHDMPQGF
jgi:hypothetical protein